MAKRDPLFGRWRQCFCIRLAFNLISPGTNSVSDRIAITNTLNLNGGAIQIANTPTGPNSLGYYKIIQYAGSIQGESLSSLTLPPTQNNIVYTLDTSHDPGFIDVHRGFLGDANDDGIVNFADFVLLSNHFGATGTGWSGGDFNSDGITNFADFVLLSNNFGQSVGSSAELSSAEIAAFHAEAADFGAPSSVPEPASLALMGLGATVLFKRRQKA